MTGDGKLFTLWVMKKNTNKKTNSWKFLFVIFLFALQACNKADVPPDGTSAFAFAADITLSADEHGVEAVLDSLRNDLFSRINEQQLFASLYSGWRSQVTDEPLYQLFKAMPKGALLHAHASAIGDVDWIINRAVVTPGCCIFLGEEGLGPVRGQLGISPYHTSDVGWIPIDEYTAQEPDWQSAMYQWFTLGAEDEQEEDAWAEFERIFQRIDAFVSFSPVFTEYYQYAFEKMAAEGISYLELRTSFDPILNEDGQWIEDDELINIYNSVLNEVRATYPEFSVALIVTGWRGDTQDGVMQQVERANGLFSTYPGFIVGFDLVGEEDGWNSNGYYSEALAQAMMPLFLHAGESQRINNHNIGDALNLHAKRISHAINLVLFPYLESEILKNDVLLELCPISNQALRYVDDLAKHPGKGYLQRGLQGILGSDDPALFGTEGLTDDFFVAYLAWNLDLTSVKKLIINSINYSGMSSGSKETHLAAFNQQWDLFIEDIVSNHFFD